MDRTACIDLPAFPLQLLLRREPEWRQHPAAVVAEDRPQGKILWVNEKARVGGVLPGMRYAAAQALLPALRAGVVPPSEIDAALAEGCERLRQFTPFVESRALAGLSMGGGQSLNFGLSHLDTFAWVGGFSPAPNTKKPDELVNDSSNVVMKLKLLWLSCGDKDGLMRISRGFHETLEEKKVPHIWYVHAGGGHDFAVWKIDLYHFVPLLFR